jgi:hypothetical protein
MNSLLGRIFGPEEKDSDRRMGNIHNEELLKLFITKYYSDQVKENKII